MKRWFWDNLKDLTKAELAEFYRREAERTRRYKSIKMMVQFPGLPDYMMEVRVTPELVNDGRRDQKLLAAVIGSYASKFSQQFAETIHQDRPYWSRLLPVPAILHCPTCRRPHLCNEMCKAVKYERHICRDHWGQCDAWKAGTLNLIGVKELP